MKNCDWKLEENHVYATSCGQLMDFVDGGIKDNDFKFCPFCGGKIIYKNKFKSYERDFIINYLKGKGWCSPTTIGIAYGDSIYENNGFHNYSSSWASPKCLKLVKDGLLERNQKGHYKLKGDI